MSYSCFKVSSNGLLSFDKSLDFFRPILFPNSSQYSYIVAPFWADHDPRPAGQVSYEVHQEDADLSTVNRFLKQHTGTEFEGSWMLVAYWDNVPEYRSSAEAVSVFYYNQRVCWVTFAILAFTFFPDQHLSSCGDY